MTDENYFKYFHIIKVSKLFIDKRVNPHFGNCLNVILYPLKKII